MTLETALFAVLAAAVAVSAVGVVVSSAIVRSAVWLLFTLIAVALVYFLLGAEFLGAAQLIVYVGGTLVLLVFGGMLTSGGPFQRLPTRPAGWAVGVAVAVALFGLLAVTSLKLGRAAGPPSDGLPGVGPLGMTFLGANDPAGRPRTAFLLPFEVVSVHLLVVLVGAAYLARPKKRVPSP
jgi:NADH-quinone oxidoreductase subunit J